MSEENASIPTTDVDGQDKEQASHRAPREDWLLQTIVDMANEHNMEITATVFVGGAMVTGLLISGQKYFEQFAKEFADGFPGLEPDTHESLRQSFANHGRIYTDPEFKSTTPPSYIHMRDAHAYVSSDKGLPDNHGVLWRGRISEVTGFWMGRLEPAKQGG